MVVYVLFVIVHVVFVLFVAIIYPILAYFFLIEALIELRKMLIRKKLFDLRFGNCSTLKQKNKMCPYNNSYITKD